MVSQGPFGTMFGCGHDFKVGGGLRPPILLGTYTFAPGDVSLFFRVGP